MVPGGALVEGGGHQKQLGKVCALPYTLPPVGASSGCGHSPGGGATAGRVAPRGLCALPLCQSLRVGGGVCVPTSPPMPLALAWCWHLPQGAAGTWWVRGAHLRVLGAHLGGLNAHLRVVAARMAPACQGLTTPPGATPPPGSLQSAASWEGAQLRVGREGTERSRQEVPTAAPSRTLPALASSWHSFGCHGGAEGRRAEGARAGARFGLRTWALVGQGKLVPG